jgi:hypothetical protein
MLKRPDRVVAALAIPWRPPFRMIDRSFVQWALRVDAAKIVALSLALVSVSFLLQGHIGINFADEGFLWYGTQRTAAGDLPLRDFQSYDPGRYFWGALWFKLLGDGILSLRFSAAIVQFIGLTCGLLTLRRVLSAWSLLVPAGVVLLVWMSPLYRVFEPTTALCLVYVGIRLLEKPTVRQHFAAGACVGFAAFVGRNHGVYGVLAFVVIIVLRGLTAPGASVRKPLLAWAGGIPIGYSPMLLLFSFPGFLTAFVRSITAMLSWGATNIALPIPWPWRVYPYLGRLDPLAAAMALTIGILFLLLPTFYVVAAVLALGSHLPAGRDALLLAPICVGTVYMHYAFSRADLEHLALSIHPFLIGVLMFAAVATLRHRRLVMTLTLAGLVLVSAVSVVVASPGYLRLTAPRTYVKADIAGDTIWLDPRVARFIKRIKSLNDHLIAPTEGLVLGPHFPGFYSILERKSPLWEIYFLLPATPVRQGEMIARLRDERVNWAIIHDARLDGRDDLRFPKTHPILWKHLMDDFESIPTSDLPPSYYLLHRKGRRSRRPAGSKRSEG